MPLLLWIRRMWSGGRAWNKLPLGTYKVLEERDMQNATVADSSRWKKIWVFEEAEGEVYLIISSPPEVFPYGIGGRFEVIKKKQGVVLQNVLAK